MSESRLTNKSNTEYEKREDAARQFLDAYPHLALVREGLSVKAITDDTSFTQEAVCGKSACTV